MPTRQHAEPAAPAGGRAEHLRRLDARLPDILESHFDPIWGSVYWIERERRLGLDVRREVGRVEDLDLLGLMPEEELASRSIWDFVPRRLQERLEDLVVAETGGTTGRPRRTAYVLDDFTSAFVDPFLAAVRHYVPFEPRSRWLWVGPSGPHVVGKAVRAICRACGSPDPFSIDFDPRWYRSQLPGSIGRARYMQHITDQALDVIRAEPVEVLFSTPPVLIALGEAMAQECRSRILGVHLGGLPLDLDTGRRLLELFPEASFLSGYGNTLLGVCPQVENRSLERPRYYPHGDRLLIRVVSEASVSGGRPDEGVAAGERGRILATRLDMSFLIVNLLERDTAALVPPPEAGRVAGFHAPGLESPAPARTVSRARLGIY